MPVDANFSEVEDAKDFPLIPEGEYVCVVDSVVEKESDSGSGNKVWKVKLEVKGGEYDKGIIFDNLTWSSATMPRVKCFMDAIGVDVAKDETVTYTTDGAIGKEVRVAVVVKPNTYNGVTTDRTQVTFAGYGKVEDGQIKDGELPVGEDGKPIF